METGCDFGENCFLKSTACVNFVSRNQGESGARHRGLRVMRSWGQAAASMRVVSVGRVIVLNGKADAIGRAVTIRRRGNSSSAVNLLILCGSRANAGGFRQKFTRVLYFVPILQSSAAATAAAFFVRRPVFLE